jgi:hypothetical protein
MANGLIGAVSNERIEAAVDRTLRLRLAGRGTTRIVGLGAVEETFRTCVTGAEDAFEHPPVRDARGLRRRRAATGREACW